MINLLKFIPIITLITNYVCAQSGTKIWDKRFGGSNSDYFGSMVATSDGGFLLGGTSWSYANGDKTQGNLGYGDFWVIKIDVNGNKVWDKRFGGTGGEGIKSILATNDGSFLLAGSSTSGANGDKSQVSQGNSDYWIVKIDANGNKLWDKSFGGNLDDDLICTVATNDGGFLLCGESGSDASGDKTQASQGGYDYWVVKIDGNGNKLWDKRFGGTGTESLSSIIKTNDGAFILGGDSSSNISGDKTQMGRGLWDYWIIKIDNNGNKIWDKRFGGSEIEYSPLLCGTLDDSFLIGGSSYSSSNGDKSQVTWGGSDFWVIKVDVSGNKIWDKRFGGTNGDFLSSLILTTDGGFLLSGYSFSEANGDKSQTSRGGSDYWVVKIDRNGNKIWDKRYGGLGNDFLYCMLLTPNLDFLLGGYTLSGANGDKTQGSWGEEDFWVAKISGICSLSLNLESTKDDISSGIVIKEGTNNSIGTIIATNKVSGSANVTYRARGSIILNAGFNSDNGTIFKTEINGCSN